MPVSPFLPFSFARAIFLRQKEKFWSKNRMGNTFCLNRFKKTLIFFGALFISVGVTEEVEILTLDVVPYELLIQGDSGALRVLEKALYEKGIAGIKGVPEY